MKFSVPQFIEVEDKIFGPLTFKQFLYIAGGAGLTFLIFNFIPIKFIAFILTLPILGGSVALAFLKINERPLISTIESALVYLIKTKLYIWKKKAKPVEKKEIKETATESYVPKLSDSRLKDLAWSLDVLDIKRDNDR